MADPYLIPGTFVLKNKLGVTDADELATAEYEIVEANAAELFESQRAKHGFQVSMHAWRTVHKMLFRDIYEWAGKYRTIFISKENHRGISRFCPPERIDVDGSRALDSLRATLRHVGRDPFEKICDGMADAYVALNEIHPFREGNGRSQKMFFTLMARQYGVQIDWSAIPAEEHNMAAIEGAAGEMERMRAHFQMMCTLQPASSIQLRFPGNSRNGDM